MENVLIGLTNIFQLSNILFIFLGVVFGIIVGAMPGLSVTLGVSLMLPFTFGMAPETGIVFLIGIYCAGIFAGSITAILIRTPGSPASAATMEDGYALAQQGKATEALNGSLYASVFGGLFSGIVLLFVSPVIVKFALLFGPPEYFTLALFGMTVIASVSGKSLSKGMVMAALGMLFATVGVDPISGTERLTFGNQTLLSGIELLPVLIGLFAISEVLVQSERRSKTVAHKTDVNLEKFGWKNMIPFRKTLMRSSIIGSIVGAIPGTGAEISSYISYSEAKRNSKEPEKFGKGSLDGVVAAEAGNNGVTGATLIPMMTLGIPGGIVAAVLLGALLIQGLNPGPQLFSEYGDIAYTVIFGFILANIVMFICGKLSIGWFAKVTLIPRSMLFPVVLGLCLVGAYAYTNSIHTVVITLVFGMLGYILSKSGYPLPPMLIALILGPIAETSLRQSLILSDGSMLIFLQRPITIVFIILILVSTAVPLLRRKKAN